MTTGSVGSGGGAASSAEVSLDQGHKEESFWVGFAREYARGSDYEQKNFGRISCDLLTSPEEVIVALDSAIKTYIEFEKEPVPKSRAAQFIRLLTTTVRREFVGNEQIEGRCQEALSKIDSSSAPALEILSKAAKQSEAPAAGSAEKSGILQTLGKFGKKIKKAIREEFPAYIRQAFSGMHTRVILEKNTGSSISDLSPRYVELIKNKELRECSENVDRLHRYLYTSQYHSENGLKELKEMSEGLKKKAEALLRETGATRVANEENRTSLGGLVRKLNELISELENPYGNREIVNHGYFRFNATFKRT